MRFTSYLWDAGYIAVYFSGFLTCLALWFAGWLIGWVRRRPRRRRPVVPATAEFPPLEAAQDRDRSWRAEQWRREHPFMGGGGEPLVCDNGFGV